MSYFKRSTHKYNASKVESDGHSFSSKLELAVYGLLKMRKLAGEIKEIQVQAHCYLTEARILYIPDFRCVMADGSELYVEAKGYETDVYRIKCRLWKHYGFGPLEIWKGSPTRLNLHETILPKTNKLNEE